MPYNPYPNIASKYLTKSDEIDAAFSNIETELNSLGAPDTVYLELIFAGGKVNRYHDGTRVIDLDPGEQKRLYSQLNGLFMKALEDYYF